MAFGDIDFEGVGQNGNTPPTEKGKDANSTGGVNQDDTTHLDGGNADDVTGKDGNATQQQTPPATNDPDTTSSTGSFQKVIPLSLMVLFIL